jgi:hypothetical protein
VIVEAIEESEDEGGLQEKNLPTRRPEYMSEREVREKE